MFIVACNCGAAITGDDRAAVIEATSEHLRKAPSIPSMTAMLTPEDHFALIGAADAKIMLTAVIEDIEARP